MQLYGHSRFQTRQQICNSSDWLPVRAYIRNGWLVVRRVLFHVQFLLCSLGFGEMRSRAGARCGKVFVTKENDDYYSVKEQREGLLGNSEKGMIPYCWTTGIMRCFVALSAICLLLLNSLSRVTGGLRIADWASMPRTLQSREEEGGSHQQRTPPRCVHGLFVVVRLGFEYNFVVLSTILSLSLSFAAKTY